MILETFVRNVFTLTKNKIIMLAKTELSNTTKKEKLDEFILEHTYTLLDTLPLNFICKWAIKKYLLPLIPTITQQIYDILKVKIEGL